MLGVGDNIRISWIFKTCLPITTLLSSSMCHRFLKNELLFFLLLSDSIKMLPSAVFILQIRKLKAYESK